MKSSRENEPVEFSSKRYIAEEFDRNVMVMHLNLIQSLGLTQLETFDAPVMMMRFYRKLFEMHPEFTRKSSPAGLFNHLRHTNQVLYHALCNEVFERAGRHLNRKAQLFGLHFEDEGLFLGKFRFLLIKND